MTETTQRVRELARKSAIAQMAERLDRCLRIANVSPTKYEYDQFGGDGHLCSMITLKIPETVANKFISEANRLYSNRKEDQDQ